MIFSFPGRSQKCNVWGSEQFLWNPIRSSLTRRPIFNCQILLLTINNKTHSGPSWEDKVWKMQMIIDLDAVRIWVCCSLLVRCLLYNPSLSFRRRGVKYDETSLIIEEDHHRIPWLSRSERKQILKRAKESPKRIKPTLSEGINKIYLSSKEAAVEGTDRVTSFITRSKRWHRHFFLFLGCCAHETITRPPFTAQDKWSLWD